MNENVKLGLSIGGIAIAAFVIYDSYVGTRVGSAGNNGVTTGVFEPPKEARDLMEKAMARRPQTPPENVDFSDPAARQAMRKQFEEQFTPEEREKLKAFREEMQTRMERTRAALPPDQQRELGRRMGQMMRSMRRNRPAEQPAAPPAN